MVAVVVVDHDAARLALALQPAADAREARQPAAMTARRRGRVASTAAGDEPARWRRCAAPPSAGAPASGPSSASRPATQTSVASRIGVDDASEDAAARPPPSRTAARSPRPMPPTRCGVASTIAWRRGARPVARSRSTSAADARVTDVGDEGRRRPARGADPRLEAARTTAPRPRRRPGWSHSTRRQDHDAGRYASKLPAYSSASTTKARRGPSARLPAPRPSATPAAARRRTPPGRAPAATSTWTSQPAVVLLPCVPATATSVRPTAASATTCCHGSTGIPRARAAAQLGVVGLDRRQRLGDREPVRVRAAGDVRRIVLPARSGCRLPPAPACTAMARPGRSRSTTAPGPRAPSRAAALAPAPAAPMTWIRSPGRIARAVAAGARPAPVAPAERVTPAGRRRARSTRSSSNSRAASALRRLLPPVAGPDVPRTSTPDRVRHRDVGQPDRLRRRFRRPGPQCRSRDTARSAPEPLARPGRHRHRGLGATGAVRRQHRVGTPSRSPP